MNATTCTRDERGNLVFKLTRVGREELAYLREKGTFRSDETIFLDLIEYHLCNGLGLLRPEEVGALTDSLILTDGHHDDDGEYEGDGSVWWFPNYMIRGYLDELAGKDGITFEKEVA